MKTYPDTLQICFMNEIACCYRLSNQLFRLFVIDCETSCWKLGENERVSCESFAIFLERNGLTQPRNPYERTVTSR